MYNSKIYLIRCGEFYKIGRTCNSVNSRLSTLQTSNPIKLELIHFIDKLSKSQSITEEYKLHSMFKHCLESGEWFKLTINEISNVITYMNSIIPEEYVEKQFTKEYPDYTELDRLYQEELLAQSEALRNYSDCNTVLPSEKYMWTNESKVIVLIGGKLTMRRLFVNKQEYLQDPENATRYNN
mgnify:CR=1 FL=1